jgi:hypothetical protein
MSTEHAIAVLACRKSRERSDDANAFFPDPYAGREHACVRDAFAETLAEAFVASATSGEEETREDLRDELTIEELGGPFVVTAAQEEFGRTVDGAGDT